MYVCNRPKAEEGRIHARPTSSSHESACRVEPRKLCKCLRWWRTSAGVLPYRELILPLISIFSINSSSSSSSSSSYPSRATLPIHSETCCVCRTEKFSKHLLKVGVAVERLRWCCCHLLLLDNNKLLNQRMEPFTNGQPADILGGTLTYLVVSFFINPIGASGISAGSS